MWGGECSCLGERKEMVRTQCERMHIHIECANIRANRLMHIDTHTRRYLTPNLTRHSFPPPPYSGSASSILSQTPPFTYAVMSLFTQTFSKAFLPGPDAHAAGGLASGFESMSNDIPLKAWTRRAIITDASLYANCCPRQIRGPALNGRKMKGLATRYLWARSSKKRSGSNSSAMRVEVNGES